MQKRSRTTTDKHWIFVPSDPSRLAAYVISLAWLLACCEQEGDSSQETNVISSACWMTETQWLKDIHGTPDCGAAQCQQIIGINDVFSEIVATWCAMTPGCDGASPCSVFPKTIQVTQTTPYFQWGSYKDQQCVVKLETLNIDPLQPFRIAGVTPIQRTQDGSFVEVCEPGTTVDGIRFQVNLVTTQRKDGNGDLQVRTNDFGAGTTAAPWIAKQLFEGDFGPHNFVFGTSNTLETLAQIQPQGVGIDEVSAIPTRLTFVSHNFHRTNPVATALLVDHSSSMESLYGEAATSAAGSDYFWPTDPLGLRFLRAGTDFISNLNDSDLLIAYYFNEQGVIPACSSTDMIADDFADLPTDHERELKCFFCDCGECRSNHRWIFDQQTESGGFNRLINNRGKVAGQSTYTSGRTPLWTAADHAWEFLSQNAADLPKQIVILTDSPDTCHPASPNYFVVDGSCGTVSYQEFLAKVKKTPPTERARIHFIQLQSIGHPRPDPAQMQMACVTGGIYRFVETLDVPRFSYELSDALAAAFTEIAMAKGAQWRLDVEVPALADGFIPGSMMSLAGEVNADLTSIAGHNKGGESFGDTQDMRPLIVQTYCQNDEDCASAGGSSESICITDGNGCATTRSPTR